MRALALSSTALAFCLALAAPAGAVKNVKYTEVKVDFAAQAETDPAFAAFRTALRDAIDRKDAAALVGLVAPTFVSTVNGSLSSQLDLGRDAAHNFRVAFGFRQPGQDADTPAQDGPYWEALADLTREPGVEKPEGTTNLLCGPPTPTVSPDALEQAQRTIQEPNEVVDWYFTQPDTEVTASAGGGASLGKVGRIAVPVLDVSPSAPEGQTAPPPTHYQILLPSGRTGWVAARAAQPLLQDQLCYARTADGGWRIGSYAQIETDAP